MSKEDFKQRIWQQVAAIPQGRVASYGQIARLCGFPKHARYVGFVMKSLPDNSQIPWDRVVNALGRLAFSEGSALWHKQKALLEQENIIFHNNKINMRVYAG